MMKSPIEPDAERQLSAFRDRIDALDDQLIGLLVERMGIVRDVAALKAEHWPSDCHVRSGREGAMHRRIATSFVGTIFPPRAAVGIWRYLIGASTSLESPLHIAYLADHPEHRWMAREYFGLTVKLSAVGSPTLAEAGNVLVLPAPDQPGATWWHDAPWHNGERLFLFARLPLVADDLPAKASNAVALAAIEPESSGEAAGDVSYFVLRTKGSVVPTCQLVIYDGFVTPDDARVEQLRSELGDEVVDLQWLGAHPRPLTPGDVDE